MNQKVENYNKEKKGKRKVCYELKHQLQRLILLLFQYFYLS